MTLKRMWYKLANRSQSLCWTEDRLSIGILEEEDGYESRRLSCRRRWLLKINGGQVLM